MPRLEPELDTAQALCQRFLSAVKDDRKPQITLSSGEFE